MIYWQPDVDPGTVLLRASVLTPNVPVMSLPQVDHTATRHDPNGTSVLLRASASSLRLLLLDNSDPSASLAAIIPLDTFGFDRIDAVTRLWRAVNNRPISPHARLTSQRRQRLRRMLQAIDGHFHGASYREIAIALYGQRRVAREHWKTSPLRDSTIALVRDGHSLIAGGYRTLLQKQRRS